MFRKSSCVFLILASLALGFTAVSAAAGTYVPVHAAHSGFGPFEEFPEPYVPPLSALIVAFGAPSSRSSSDDLCHLVWSGQGIRVKLFRVGRGGSACTNGAFDSARLTGHGWHTAAGIQTGSSAAMARKASVVDCRGKEGVKERACWGLRDSVILGFHRSDCAPGRFPTVAATIADGRVSSLLVMKHGCE